MTTSLTLAQICQNLSLTNFWGLSAANQQQTLTAVIDCRPTASVDEAAIQAANRLLERMTDNQALSDNWTNRLALNSVFTAMSDLRRQIEAASRPKASEPRTTTRPVVPAPPAPVKAVPPPALSKQPQVRRSGALPTRNTFFAEAAKIVQSNSAVSDDFLAEFNPDMRRRFETQFVIMAKDRKRREDHFPVLWGLFLENLNTVESEFVKNSAAKSASKQVVDALRVIQDIFSTMDRIQHRTDQSFIADLARRFLQEARAKSIVERFNALQPTFFFKDIRLEDPYREIRRVLFP